jgi:hypothetical protein
MRKAWTILMRAIRDITDNPLSALQITVLPMLIFVFVGTHWLERATAAQAGFFLVPGRFVWWMWALGIAGVTLPLLWIAVGWHRLILLGERPLAFAPRLHFGRILAYGGRSFVLLLIALVVTLVIVVLLVVLAQAFGLFSDGAGGKRLGESVGSFLGTFLFLMLSPAVVATACGQRMTLSEAFRHGDRATVAIFWLTVASFGLTWLLEAIVGAMRFTGVGLEGYVLVSSWFLTLFNVGILTAIAADAAPMPPLPPTPEPATPWQ